MRMTGPLALSTLTLLLWAGWSGCNEPQDSHPISPFVAEQCVGGRDEDEDGAVDCADDDCAASDRCDSDGDGYIDLNLGGNDCDDNAPGVHPGAPDVCADGIDADCVDGDPACGPGEQTSGDSGSGGSGSAGDSGGSGGSGR